MKHAWRKKNINVFNYRKYYIQIRSYITYTLREVYNNEDKDEHVARMGVMWGRNAYSGGKART
jgi:hypothetical protein